jgi:hypothetical protein
MRISKQFALIMAFVLALACGYATAAEGEDLDKGKEATTAPAAKDAADYAATQPAYQQPTLRRKKSFWAGNIMLFVMLFLLLLLAACILGVIGFVRTFALKRELTRIRRTLQDVGPGLRVPPPPPAEKPMAQTEPTERT